MSKGNKHAGRRSRPRWKKSKRFKEAQDAKKYYHSPKKEKKDKIKLG